MTLLRGQTARINCSLWGREEWGDSARYYWSRHDSPIGCNRSQDFLKNGPRLTTRSDGSLVLLDVAVSDADTYYCCVVADTRPWTRLSGNGTQLNVQESPGHVKNIGNQTTRKWVKDSVNKDKASLRDETLQYASVKFNNPPKGTQKQNLRTPEETFAKEYAVLKVKDKNNL